MKSGTEGKPKLVLMIDDSPADTRLVQEGLREADLAWQLHFVKDAPEAKVFLRQDGGHQRAPRPQLILLDLNLPQEQGLQLLEWIKTDPGLREIPVVVLSSSSWDIDVIKAYGLHANSYFTKPLRLDQFADMLSTLDKYWFQLAQLPSQV